MTLTIKDEIALYILSQHDISEPIIQKKLYRVFASINPITIRQTLRRLSFDGLIIKSENIPGVYFLPNPKRVLTTHTIDFTKFIEKKFIKDNKNNFIGYESGFSIANRLGLTSQTPSLFHVYSNAVADRKREVIIDNRRFMINQAKVNVNNNNYKFLQVLDLISDFDTYCEIEKDKALSIFKAYLSPITLNRKEIETILAHYPMKTELNYYKLEIDHVIALRF